MLLTATKVRQKIETEIVTSFVKAIFKNGFTMSLNNGYDPETHFDSAKKALRQMMQTDEEEIFIYKNGSQIGTAKFVYGNDGFDCLTDYSLNLESVLSEFFDVP